MRRAVPQAPPLFERERQQRLAAEFVTDLLEA